MKKKTKRQRPSGLMLNSAQLTKQMSEMMLLASAEWTTIPNWVHWSTLRGLERRELIETNRGHNQFRAKQQKTMTFDEAKAAMRAVDPDLYEGDPAFRCGVVLILSAAHGPKLGTLTYLTGYNRKELSLWAANWWRQRVWANGRVNSNWHDEKTGGIAFLCDINAGLGLIERVGTPLMRSQQVKT